MLIFFFSRLQQCSCTNW